VDKIFSEFISLKCALIVAANAAHNTYKLPNGDTVAAPLVRIRPCPGGSCRHGGQPGVLALTDPDCSYWATVRETSRRTVGCQWTT
jgi:hypothetical protein